ncbi:MAG TPA: type III-A CRISPR-associated protein Cas10/Csm1 [Candidatus Wunengus californicus]|uniref:type III-A CRISPR-associated protein Cas10/Csm1 n=1 Tax=Candidatus Wunengus californicus TaxID=3367619 RepID=UPI0040253A23
MRHEELIRSIFIEGLREVRKWFQDDSSDFLQSIFSQISIKDRTGGEPHFYVTPSFMEISKILKEEDRKILLEEKQKVWQAVHIKYCDLSEEFLTNLSLHKAHFLLENLGGTIPALNSEGKTSIYDTYKIKAVKEVVRTRKKGDTSGQANLLICGDLSGIQQFIYNISSQNALKNLRARSFFIELLSEHIVQRILDLFQLHRIHLLFSGGGSFYILLDNQGDSCKKLAEITHPLETWFAKQFNGRLYAAITSVPFSGENLKSHFDSVMENAAYNLFIEKQAKFKRSISTGKFEFLQKCDPSYQGCEICFKDDEALHQDKDGFYRCSYCQTLIEIGALLPKAKYVYKSANIPFENPIFIENSRYILTDEKHPVSNNEIAWKICQELSDLEGVYNEESIPLVSPYTRLTKDLPIKEEIKKRENFLKEILQKDEIDDKVRIEIKEDMNSLADDTIASLEWLAESANGAKLIGALRMDADNMGKILQSGFTEGISLERLSALSRALVYFFKIHISRICKSKIENPTNITNKDFKDLSKGRNVTVIYSGGDDLFLIGAWSDVAELSLDIGKAFKQYTGNHLDVTLSGGMTLHDQKFPIIQMAQLSAKALKAAKDNKQACWQCRKEFLTCPLFENGLCGRKDSLSLFYTEYAASLGKTLQIEKQSRQEDSPPRLRIALKWARVKEDKGIENEIEDYVEDTLQQYWRAKDFLPRSFFHRALQLQTVWYNSGYLYVPQVVWLLEKMKKSLGNRRDKETGMEYYELLDRQLHFFEPYRLSSQHIPLMWLIYLTRGGETSEGKVDRGETL